MSTAIINIDAQARYQQLESFQAEYAGTRCSVCSADKWPNYPFCRPCSIRLQRAHLMRQFSSLRWSRAQNNWANWPADVLQQYAKHYDLCRDFLINGKREKESA